MRQVLQNLRSGETSVVDVPVPTPRPGTALVQTAASLVSPGTERMVVDFAEKSMLGKARARPDLVRQVWDKARREGILSTLETAFGRLDEPMPLGYSSAGTIVEVGAGLDRFQVGQRVACAGGGYAVHADFVLIPQNLIAPLPEDLDFESAAFVTLGSIALHGFRLSGAQLGDRVMVIGLGLMGLLTVGIAIGAGCHVLGVDLDLNRVRLAERIGAQAVLRPQAEEAAQAFSRRRGCDAVLICADTRDSDPVHLAGQVSRDRGKVVAVGAVGMEIPRRTYYEKELSFLVSRSYGPGRYDPAYEEGGQDYPIGYVRWTEGRNMEAFLDLLASGEFNVRQLITHRYPIDQAPEAYELITGKRKEPYIGVLLTYPDIPAVAPASRRTRLERTEQRGDTLPAGTRLRLGVLGAGNFAGAVALPAIRQVPGIERVGIASASGKRAQVAARRFGFQYATSSAEDIIKDPAVTAVAIFTRHDLHAGQILAALEAGKHVFCEKPLALNGGELEAILAALESAYPAVGDDLGGSGQPEGDVGTAESPEGTGAEEPPSPPLLMVGFNRRFSPFGRQLQSFFRERSEPLVAQYRINAGYLPPEHWLHDPAQGGGRIIGEACHFIDFVTFLVGETPSSVFARALPGGGRYREDNVVMTFSFPDGSLGTVTYLANGDKSLPKERLEVFAAGRVAVLDDFRELRTIERGRQRQHKSRMRQDKGHKGAWGAFTEAVTAGGPPPIPYDQLFAVSRATFAVLESLRTGEEIWF